MEDNMGRYGAKVLAFAEEAGDNKDRTVLLAIRLNAVVNHKLIVRRGCTVP